VPSTLITLNSSSPAKPSVIAPLDGGFLAAAFAHHRARGPASLPLVIGLEREAGGLSRYETVVDPSVPGALQYVERLVKFLLWARGGWKIHFGGLRAIGERLRMRKFDTELMSRVYERPFEIALMKPEDVPAEKEISVALGGHLDGCRIGFDLGASDYKVAAVKNGTAVYSEEFPWNPRDHHAPQYHFDHLNHGLKKAAAHLPRVDAIGGSTAGVVVDNKIMVASLFRSVPADKFDDAKNIFHRLQREWNVPLEVANDGDVTALAGALALNATGILGVAMGSSQAAGFIDHRGRILGWLNELAFAPVDENPHAAVDEWSGDRGVGALYFSQQALNKLLPAARIDVPKDMALPERLGEAQTLAQQGDPRATRIFETIGVYLGYTVPHYAEFYDFRHLLILGRVTTGVGGNIILAKAREVLQTDFPRLAERVAVHLPDEKSRRVGQAVAAASLPEMK
jgi:predicted NBD/HSP70 family sugar kinase